MSYLERLKAEFSEKALPSELTKPTKAPSVSFVSAQGRRISEIEEREPRPDGGADTLPDPVAEARRQTADPEVFDFSPPGDPANDDEALQERAAIMAEANGWSDATALQEARWQADRERCWRAFLRNAGRILGAPRGEWERLLARYRAEAEARYGAATAADMVSSMRSWIEARPAEAGLH